MIAKYSQFILGAALAVFVILYVTRCNGDAKDADERDAMIKRNAELVKRIAKDSVDRESERIQSKLRIDKMQAAQQAGKVRIVEKDAQLTDLRGRIRELSYKILNPEISDSVSLRYWLEDTCTMLAEKALQQDEVIGQLKETILQVNESMVTEIGERDTEMKKEKAYASTLLSQLRSSASRFDSLANIKSRGAMLLGGVSLFGNRTTFLSGTSFDIAYQTKGGKLYKFSTVLIKNDVLYSAGVLIPLIK